MVTFQLPNSINEPLSSERLQHYLKNKFTEVKKRTESIDELEDGSRNSFWEKNNKTELEKGNVFQQLKYCFPQLCFQIGNGINESLQYRSATLRGIMEDISIQNNTLQLVDEPGISFSLYESFAGDIPVLIIPEEKDFIKVIQALLYKNNPVTVPSSMGATFIRGINNWQRIRDLKTDYLSKNPGVSWNKEFKENIVSFPNLYKDNIILLSKKPYSNISSKDIGIEKNDWLSLSLKIRLEHECTHLYTFKNYGSTSNNLHDELIADYVGIVRSFGRYNKKWMLLFMGLEDYPAYRNGARLENYVYEIGFDKTEFSTLTTIIKKSIENIYRFDLELGEVISFDDLKARVGALCSVDLLDIASVKGTKLLLDQYSSIE